MSFAFRLLALSVLLLLAIAIGCSRQAVAGTVAGTRHHTSISQEMRMSSTLTPDNLPAGPDRRIHQGHGTSALGPSDSSDSGSDLQGALDTAGAEIGDDDLDSDSDRSGTGERAAASPDTPVRDGADIGTDHIEQIPDFDD